MESLSYLILLVTPLLQVQAMDNLKVAYHWKMLDFEFPSEEDRQLAIENKTFIPENNLPIGLEVYKDRLFITVPRWKSGVAASLGYINLTTDPSDSPKLKPYPDWESHNLSVSSPQIVSPFKIRADACDRLWVLDTGIANLLEENVTVYSPPRILIYDLNTDTLMRTYEIPEEQTKKGDTFFANIAVEDNDCIDSYAYLADISAPALVVYSFKKQTSWLVKHNYFHISPEAGEMTVSGVTFQWSDGLYGLALSGPDSEGYSTLYFHPLTSFDEFAVSTKVLRNEDIAKSMTSDTFHQFKRLGSRGPKSQSGASFLDKKTGVLFYALVNLNAVACWRTTNKAYTMESQGRIFVSNVSMVFPNDVKVDNDHNLWVLSDKLPVFMYSSLDPTETNFRIMTAKVPDAIRGTACDSKLVVSQTIMDKITPVLNSTLGVRSRGMGTTTKSVGTMSVASVVLSILCFCAIMLR